MSPAFIQIHMVNTVGECISLNLIAKFWVILQAHLVKCNGWRIPMWAQ